MTKIRAVIIVSLLICFVFPLASGAAYDILFPISNSSETITFTVTGDDLNENLHAEYQNGRVIFTDPNESNEKISQPDVNDIFFLIFGCIGFLLFFWWLHE